MGGLDLGRRADYSALVLVDAGMKKITGAYRLKQASYRDQVRSIAPLLNGTSLLAVDRGGVGDGVVELLPGSVKVLPVVITGGEGFRLKPDGSVSASKHGLVELLRVAGLRMPPGAPGRAELLREMQAYVTRDGGRMEADTGHHDDLVMAAALAALACAQALQSKASDAAGTEGRSTRH